MDDRIKLVPHLVAFKWTRNGLPYKKDMLLLVNENVPDYALDIRRRTEPFLNLIKDADGEIQTIDSRVGAIRHGIMLYNGEPVQISNYQSFSSTAIDDAVIRFAVLWGMEHGSRSSQESVEGRDAAILEKLRDDSEIRSLLTSWAIAWQDQGCPDMDEYFYRRLSEAVGFVVEPFLQEDIEVASDYSRYLEDAKARADQIIEDAKADADQIVDDASAKADAMLESASRKLAEAEEASRRKLSDAEDMLSQARAKEAEVQSDYMKKSGDLIRQQNDFYALAQASAQRSAPVQPAPAEPAPQMSAMPLMGPYMSLLQDTVQTAVQAAVQAMLPNGPRPPADPVPASVPPASETRQPEDGSREDGLTAGMDGSDPIPELAPGIEHGPDPASRPEPEDESGQTDRPEPEEKPDPEPKKEPDPKPEDESGQTDQPKPEDESGQTDQPKPEDESGQTDQPEPKEKPDPEPEDEPGTGQPDESGPASQPGHEEPQPEPEDEPGTGQSDESGPASRPEPDPKPDPESEGEPDAGQSDESGPTSQPEPDPKPDPKSEREPDAGQSDESGPASQPEPDPEPEGEPDAGQSDESGPASQPEPDPELEEEPGAALSVRTDPIRTEGIPPAIPDQAAVPAPDLAKQENPQPGTEAEIAARKAREEEDARALNAVEGLDDQRESEAGSEYGDTEHLDDAGTEGDTSEPEPDAGGALPGTDQEMGEPVTFFGDDELGIFEPKLPAGWQDASQETLLGYLERIHPKHLLAVMERPEVTALVKYSPVEGAPAVDREWPLINLYESVYGGWDAANADATRSKIIVHFLNTYAKRDIAVIRDGAKRNIDMIRYIALLLSDPNTFMKSA